MIWTIAYNGTEKTLADWGFINVTRTLLSQGQDTLTFKADGTAADAPNLFTPFGPALTLYRNRRQATDGSFSGGTPWFQGIVTQIPRSGSPRSESMQYKVAGPWWYLENLVFQQPFNAFNGYTIPNDPSNPPLYIASESDTHLFLNLAPINAPTSTGKISTGQQIIEALNWALKPFVTASVTPPFQIGTVTPALDVPIDEVRDITCAEVIHKMLRWSPDAVCWFDYTTSPPTFNCKRRSELTPAEVALSAGNLAESLEISARYDLQSPYVRVRYETVNTIQGTQATQVVTDQYPDPLPAGPNKAFSGLDFTVDLQGANTSVTTAAIKVDPINALAPDVNAQQTWWLGKHPQYTPHDPSSPADAENPVTSFTILPGSVARTPTNAGETDLGYANELTSGQITPWMNFGAQRMTFTCKATIVYRNGTFHENYPVTYQCVATNSTTGTFNSTRQNAFAEPIPSGLARFMYDALSPLQFEGQVTFQEEDASGSVLIGKLLNFTNGALAEWATMNSLIQQVVENIDTGQTTVHFGPPKHLSAGDLVDLLRVNRSRHIFVLFSMQQQGTPGFGSGTLALGQNTSEKNSSSTVSPPGIHVTSATVDGSDAAQVAHQSDKTSGDCLTYWGGNFQVDQPLDASPTTGVPAAILVRLSDARGNAMWVQPLKICQNGVPGTIYFLCSAFIPDP